ncbi:hypothetical protein ACJZ2D_003649 [Fusarium nematophilum]
MAANKPPDDTIVIGIDFGTTYSGVAWAYSREPEEIELVTSWDAELNHCSDVEKAPTQLFYDGDSEATWGYSIPSDKSPLKWFKLLLLDEADVPADVSASSQLREARRLQVAADRDPVDIIGCFLRKLWNHAIESIRRSVGAELLQRAKFHVVITLPAIWPPYAQQRMKQAAKISGILDSRACGETTLRFISEPEAAALATLRDLSKRSTLKPGDTVVVCDAGGGTVDLISYVVESTSPFVVKECVKGDGALCGAVFLDEEFLKLIKSKIPAGSWSQVSKEEVKKFLNDGWEHGIKPQFANQQRNWLVDLPDACSASSSGRLKRRRSLELSTNDVLSVFTPIVDQIEALVRRQTQAIQQKYHEPPKHIILVGGFGRSRYLFHHLQATFESTILQSRGNKPWTAICRGAVVDGLTRQNLSPALGVTVEARIARMSYGISYRTPFLPECHQPCDKIWSEERQEFMARNQMQWFLQEGDDLRGKHAVRESYSRYYSNKIGKVKEEIYCCSEFPPPSRVNDAVRRLCQVKWNRKVRLESLPTWTNKIGKVYHKLKYEVEMTCEDGTVDFTIYHDGKRAGGRSVQVKFD